LHRETDGQHRALLFASLLKNMVNIKLDHVIRACRSNEADGSLEADVESVQQALKVLYGWNALLEDDHRIFAWMLNADTPMVMRSKAAASRLDRHPRERVAQPHGGADSEELETIRR